MMPSMISFAGATAAYVRARTDLAGSGPAPERPPETGFAALVRGAIGDAVTAGRASETLSKAAVADRADLTQVVTAVGEAETMLNTVVVDVVRALVTAQEAKDPFLRGHSDRVADLAASIATALGLSDDTVEELRTAGRLMDVGKIGIRESVLNKPGALTPEEFDHVKTHVEIGLDILSTIKPIAHLLPAIQDHHEHWDGNGYPRKLKGEQISLGGRILHAADAFDAIDASH